MSDTAELAHTVLGRNLRLKAGESVIIESWNHTLDYVPAFVSEARRLGAQATVLFEDERTWWDDVAAKRFRAFQHLSPVERAAVRAADVYVYFWGPADMRRALDLGDAVGSKISGYNEEWYASAKRGGLRGCRMQLGLASDETAKRFGMSGPEWRDRMVAAGTVEGRPMNQRGYRIAQKLARGSELRLRHPNGTDLRIPLRVAASRVDAGVVDPASRRRPRGMLTNNPSGQVIVALDPGKVTGTIASNRPVYNMGSYERFAESHWTFESGRLTEQEMGVNGEAFAKAYGAAGKGRDQVTFLSVGLNPMTRELPPCEDTEEGSVLVGIGGNAGFGGRVKIPFQGHSLLAGALVEVDGAAIARDGRLV